MLVKQQLGKVYWDLGEYEASIAYRVAFMDWSERTERPDLAANTALVVANTYHEKLGRPVEAIPYYQKALALHEAIASELTDVANERLAQCVNQDARGQAWLYRVLVESAGSEEAADQHAVRLALHMGGANLWHYGDEAGRPGWKEICHRSLLDMPCLLLAGRHAY